jgi:DNA-binding SARP family transcriptional activator
VSVVALLRAIGDASFLALALADRGEAHLGLGHFEEAEADFRESMTLYDRIGSRWKAWPIVREATLHRQRGDFVLAGARYADGARIAEALGDMQVHSEALAGLALVVGRDDELEARSIVERAVEAGGRTYRMLALQAAAQLAVERGDRDEATRLATELLDLGRRRRDQPSTALALAVLARLSAVESDRRAMLDEAESIWRRCGSPYGLASSLIVRARLVGGREARDAAVEAEGLFREIGARAMTEESARLIAKMDAASRPPVEVFALGGFRVMRDGSPVPIGEWRSKKARDLLKILVARRGRPIAREALCEELWPDDAPDPLPNRLSVLLTTIRTVLDPEHRFPPEQFVAADKTSVAINVAHLPTDVEAFFGLVVRGRGALEGGREDESYAILTAAEATYGGDFLEEDPYEDWSVGLRDEAQATYVGVARALAGLFVGRGDIDGAIRMWLRILDRDPFDEGAHLELVRVLIRASRHGEARRRYGVYADRMAEIGVEASPFPDPVRAA